MQGSFPGCVAGSHLLLGGRFGLALLDGLAAVGEVLLRFPGLLFVVRWWARAAGIRSGARSSSLMKFRRGSRRRAAGLSSRACSRRPRKRLRMEDWVCRWPASMIRPSSPLSGGAVLRAGVSGGRGQGACVCFRLCRAEVVLCEGGSCGFLVSRRNRRSAPVGGPGVQELRTLPSPLPVGVPAMPLPRKDAGPVAGR